MHTLHKDSYNCVLPLATMMHAVLVFLFLTCVGNAAVLRGSDNGRDELALKNRHDGEEQRRLQLSYQYLISPQALETMGLTEEGLATMMADTKSEPCTEYTGGCPDGCSHAEGETCVLKTTGGDWSAECGAPEDSEFPSCKIICEDETFAGVP